MANTSANVLNWVSDCKELAIPMDKDAGSIAPGSMIGVISGYGVKMDDSASMAFAGIYQGTEIVEVDSGGSDGDTVLRVAQPRVFLMKKGTAAQSDFNAVAYAKYNDEVATTATYYNLVGKIVGHESTTHAVVLAEYNAVGFNGVVGSIADADLTHITHTAPGSADYAIQDLINSNAWGFASHDEGNTVLKVVLNLQVRVAEIVTALTNAGIVA